MAETDPTSPGAAPEPTNAVDADLAAALAGAVDPSADQQSIDDLLQSASFEDPSAVEGASVPADVNEYKLPNFSQVVTDAQVSSIDLLRDVELNVKIELGRSQMLVEDVLKLAEGSVVELDKLAGDPVDVFVNDRLIARGEVLVLNDNFCVRVNEIVAGAKEEGL
ncbi:MAG TPA: flagellar motor switch protein FliN [Tepidisphaeraceae bacterium]|jgi:flagellar motor switch protein FliN/FliY|nr:flagellar motor switch protein FliN [Tepidisphaeraceae bacterium]